MSLAQEAGGVVVSIGIDPRVPGARLPTASWGGGGGAGCLDVYAPRDIRFEPHMRRGHMTHDPTYDDGTETLCTVDGTTTLVDAGFHMRVPNGYHYRVASRNDLARNENIAALADTIDATDVGNVRIRLMRTEPRFSSYTIRKGQVMCRLLLYRHAIGATIRIIQF